TCASTKSLTPSSFLKTALRASTRPSASPRSVAVLVLGLPVIRLPFDYALSIKWRVGLGPTLQPIRQGGFLFIQIVARVGPVRHGPVVQDMRAVAIEPVDAGAASKSSLIAALRYRPVRHGRAVKWSAAHCRVLLSRPR